MKKVTFNPKVFYIIDYHNHKEPVDDLLPIQIAADRLRFRDRIQRIGELLEPILKRHGKNFKEL